MVGEPILKPWANLEGQMIQRRNRMRDERGHCEKDYLRKWIIGSNKNRGMGSELRLNHNASSAAVLFRIPGIALAMTCPAAYTSISPRAISKIAFQITDSRATTDFGRAVPRDLEY